MKQHYMSPQLGGEIKDKILHVNELDQHFVSSSCQKRRRKSIEKNAQLQSFRIENPNTHVPFSVPRNKNKSVIKEGIQNIYQAFEWGRVNFDSEDFDESFFREIAGRITPEYYEGQIANYREGGTRITGASVTPPDPFKVKSVEIPGFVESLKSQLRCPEIINKIEAAVYSHLHFVRIHPFEDGNGRTSRVLQDIILDHYGIPVPMIEAGERMTYYKILDNAVNDWKHNGGKEKGIVTKGERMFYDFIAGKINVSLDNLLSTCH